MKLHSECIDDERISHLLWRISIGRLGAQAAAQLPATCKPPASATHAPAGTPPARVYDVVGTWFAEKGDLKCAVAAFQQAFAARAALGRGAFRPGARPANSAADCGRNQRVSPRLAVRSCDCCWRIVRWDRPSDDPADAEEEFRKALAVNPQLVCALDGIAQVLAKERRFDAAIDYWQRALRIQPDAEDLQLALATATYKAAKAREANGLPALDGAGVADAIRLLTDLLKNHPDMTAAYFALGNIYANEHRNREAADEYQEVIRRSSERYGSARRAGQGAHRRIGIYRSACARARLRARQPDDPSGHVMLGTVYQQLGDYASAEPELETWRCQGA